MQNTKWLKLAMAVVMLGVIITGYGGYSPHDLLGHAI